MYESGYLTRVVRWCYKNCREISLGGQFLLLCCASCRQQANCRGGGERAEVAGCMHALASGNGVLTVMTSQLGSRDLSGSFYWSRDVLYDFRRGGTPFPTYLSSRRATIALSCFQQSVSHYRETKRKVVRISILSQQEIRTKQSSRGVFQSQSNWLELPEYVRSPGGYGS